MNRFFMCLLLSVIYPTIGTAYEVDEEFLAQNCEFYVDGFVRANGRYVFGWSWIDSYISVNELDLVQKQGGEILKVGMLANGADIFFGRRINGGFFVIKTDLVPLVSNGVGGYEQGERYILEDFTFFVDVQRNNGSVHRLWLPKGGNGFEWPHSYEDYAKIQVNNYPVGRGSAWALQSDAFPVSPLFHQREACVK